MNYIKKLSTNGFSHLILPVLVVLAVAGIGTYLVYMTHAATATYQISNGNSVCVNDPGTQGQTGVNLTAKACNQASSQIFAITGSGGTSNWHDYKVYATSSSPECIGTAGNKTTAGTQLQAVACGSATSLYLNTCKQLEVAKSGTGNCNGVCVDSANGAMLLSKCADAGNWNPQQKTVKSSGGGTGSGSGSGGGTTSSSGTNCTPAPSATMTNTVSHKCGFPDTTNTGTTGTLYAVGTGPTSNTGSGWTVSGDTITVKANGVLKNVNTGGKVVSITGANATVNNVKIVAAATNVAGVSLHGANNAVVENSIIAGTNSSSGRMFAGIKDYESGSTYSAKVDLKANNVYYTSTGIQVDHGTVENNYIHDMGEISGDHINGFTSNGGGDNVLLTIQHNTVFNQIGQTDAISLFEDFAVQQNRVINDNLVAGGGYTIYGGQNSGGAAIKNIHITNNHFSKMYYKTYGYYGPITAFTTSGTGNTWSGNVDDTTGATISQ